MLKIIQNLEQCAGYLGEKELKEIGAVDALDAMNDLERPKCWGGKGIAVKTQNIQMKSYSKLAWNPAV